jgi:DNA modification methylase
MCIRLHGLRNGEPLVVMDPFVGMGATVVAARRLGCRYIGFDVSAEYIRIAEERLAGM